MMTTPTSACAAALATARQRDGGVTVLARASSKGRSRDADATGEAAPNVARTIALLASPGGFMPWQVVSVDSGVVM